MSQQINIEITTESGQQIAPFSYLTITQQFNGHHHFELRFNHDVIENYGAVIINDAKNLLGKTITFTMSAREELDHPDNVFKAVITDIAISNTVGAAGDLIFRGSSPTVILDGGPGNSAHLQRNLRQVCQEVTKDIPSNLLGFAFDPKFKSTVPFIVQYKETVFQFLRRLAGEYGEWFFYNGSELCFGKPQQAPKIPLKFPRDLADLKLNLRVAPLRFDQVDYNYRKDEKLQVASASLQAPSLGSFGDHAVRSSDQLFARTVVQLGTPEAATKQDIDQFISNEKSARAADLVCLSAVSDSPYLRPGVQVEVSATRPDNRSEEDFGSYLVLSVTHATDGLGNYQNSFEAIPSAAAIVPNAHDTPSPAEPQLAVVKANDDPDKLGRVKVQFLWQKDGETTPWIRVMSLHSGLQGDGKKNRGLFFTPEVDDYVIVGFHQNDAARPFVMGSVPHGKAIDTSKNNDNSIKAIRTRSGNTIYMKDLEDKKEQEIMILTDKSNFVKINVRNNDGTITIQSSKAIEVTSKSTINVSSEQITVKGSKIKVEASDSIEMKAKTIKIEASQELKAKSMQTTIEGSTSAKFKSSTQVDIDGGGIASMKAGLVKIN